MVHRILKMPVYYGLIKYGDVEEVMGTFEPLLDKNTWDELQDVINDRKKPTKSKWNHTYQGIIRCGKCGLAISGTTKVKLNGNTYTYYCCNKFNGNCGNPPIKVEELEMQFIEQISKLEIDRPLIEKLKTSTLIKLDKEYSFEITQRDSFFTELNDLNKKLDSLITLRIEGEITKEEHLKHKETINARITQIESLQKDLKFNREDLRITLEQFFESCFQIKDVFANGDFQEKRTIIHQVTEEIILEDKKLLWNFKKPYQVLIKTKIPEEVINGVSC